MFAGIRPVAAGLVAAAAVLIALATFRYVQGIPGKQRTGLIAAGCYYGLRVKKRNPIKEHKKAADLDLLLFR